MESPGDIDATTVAKAAAGDRAAFDALWREYNPRLRRYLASLGLRDAEDVASQAWLEAFQKLSKLDDRPGAFRRLLFTIARRRMVDELRGRGRRLDIVDVVDMDAAAEEGVEGSVADLDAAIGLLNRLPAAQAEVIALRVIGGMSAEEVGQITGQSAGAVRVMAHRALRTLQQELAPGSGVSESAVPEPDAPFLHLE